MAECVEPRNWINRSVNDLTIGPNIRTVQTLVCAESDIRLEVIAIKLIARYY